MDKIPWSVTIGIAIIVVGIVALILLRPGLMRLLDRTKKIGRDGAQFEGDQNKAQDQVQKAPNERSIETVMREPVSATVLAREDLIRERLNKLPLKSDAERIVLLTRVFAGARVALEHNVVAHLIYGSQLRFLVELNATPAGITVDMARSVWENARKTYPQLYADRRFEGWIDFLIGQNCVSVSDGKYHLTQFGADFLKHLVDTRMTHDRHG